MERPLGALNIRDQSANGVGAVLFDLLFGGREQLVAGCFLGDSDDVVGVSHHRCATTASVDEDGVVTEASRIQCGRQAGRTAADNGDLVLRVGFTHH